MNGSNTTLPDYIDTLQSQGQYWFLRHRAMSDVNLSSDAFKLAAYRLIKKTRIQRIRGEFYVIIPLEYRSVGCLPAPWFIDDLMQYCRSDYYVGLLSAAALYGAAHQQPMTFQVITNCTLQDKIAGQIQTLT
jgi:predicted transcriptional regulator of viral defense system